jgi:hypothetical protein
MDGTDDKLRRQSGSRKPPVDTKFLALMMHINSIRMDISSMSCSALAPSHLLRDISFAGEAQQNATISKTNIIHALQRIAGVDDMHRANACLLAFVASNQEMNSMVALLRN